jgi:hypothetical protein
VKLYVSFLASLCLLTSARAAEPGGDAGDLYSRITDTYMTDKFDDLKGALTKATGRLKDFTAEQKTDILYVRRALAQCRPKWWHECKAGKKTRIRQAILGKTATIIYDPDGKGGMRLQGGLGGIAVTTSWDRRTMDSTDKGMYGYLKGDMVCGSIWGNLTMGNIWSGMSLQKLAKMDDREKLRMNRYMSFRSNLAALYYGTPSARRYSMHIFFAAFFYDRWGKGPVTGTRRAVCAMIMCEILKDPTRYPSLKLPGKLKADKAEEKLGQHYKFAIKRKATWTIAEDRRLREAIKSFATTAGADKNVRQTEKVTLPNKLVFAIDVKVDEAIRAKRDAWIKKQFDKAKSSGN